MNEASSGHPFENDGVDINNQERALGISEFVSPHTVGFSCVIKQRYTDFLVNEILTNGQVLHLRDAGVSNVSGISGPGNAASMNQKDGAVPNAASEELKNGTERPPKRRQSPERAGSPEDNLEIPRKKVRMDGTDDSISDPTESSGTANTAQDDTIVSKKEQKDQIIHSVPELDIALLHGIFGGNVTSQILNLYSSVILRPDRKPRDLPTVKSEPILEKSKRTDAHVAVRRIFASKLETLTMQDQPGIMSVKAAPTKAPSGARSQPRNENANGPYQKGKLGWNELGGEYVHFTLYKENKDTMEVLYFLASKLKVPIRTFQFAGTKDRRGVTVQRVAIYRVHADQIMRLNKFARGWRVGDFTYEKHGLGLGDLGGNEFLLTLRDFHSKGVEGLPHEQRFTVANEYVALATESFQQFGFLNYYGLQRFGTFSVGTHITGQKMLKGDLEGAVDSILEYPVDMLPKNQGPSSSEKVPQDDIDRADAIRTWRATGQSNEAVDKMPKRFQAETAIIQWLSKKDRKTGRLLQDRDWQGALMQIQRNLRLMYVHAYQSFVWNTVASKRWQLYGSRLVEGDLVIVGEKNDVVGDAKDEVDEDGEPIFHPAEDDSAPNAEDIFTRARHLTKEEAESGKYDIFDIVLPLPGYDVLYPANEIGKFIEEFMASDVGGRMDPHNMRRAWKDVSLSGSYRKMMARPGKDLHVDVRSYGKDDEQMVQTDLERLQSEAAGHAKTGAIDEREQQGFPNEYAERKIAIVLKMQLGSSQYATMALRELTKGGAFNYKPEYSAR